MTTLTCGTVQLTRSRTRLFLFRFLFRSLRSAFFFSMSLTLAQQILLRGTGISYGLAGEVRAKTYPSLYAKSWYVG